MNIELKKKILSEIKPSSKDNIKNKNNVNKFIKKLEISKKKLNIDCKFKIGGSFGKNTYLKGSSDVDIFCMFNKSKYKDEEISGLLKNILDNGKINFKKQKGSRDYYSGKVGLIKKQFEFEIIPVLEIKNANDAKNTTDISPIHVDFLKKEIKKNKSLNDEIRLTKQFLKAKKIYGAESYIHGFSGHSIDILIAKYKSLDNFLKNAKKWNEITFIDINKKYKSKADAIKEFNEDKISNLILVDPIIKNRNAARALSQKNYNKFIEIAKSTTNLVYEDFKIVNENKKQILANIKEYSKKNKLKVIKYEFKITNKIDSEDIIGSKLLRLNNKLKNFFEEYQFKIEKKEFKIDIKNNFCIFAFYIKDFENKTKKEIIGPKEDMKEEITKFLKNKKEHKIVNGRIVAYEERKIKDIRKIANLSKIDLEKFLGKNLSFIQKLKITFE